MLRLLFEDIALWHERDISHSSVERVILPDSTILADYLLEQTTKLVDMMFVYPDRMRRNVDLTKGSKKPRPAFVLDPAAAGMLLREGLRDLKRLAMDAWDNEGDFRAAVEADPEIMGLISKEKFTETFSVARHLKYVDAIFRIFERLSRYRRWPW